MLTTKWIRSFRVCAFAAVATVSTLTPALAQEEAPVPIGVVSIASVERLLESGDLLFETGGRPELSDTVSGLLSRANDLKGLDRHRSMGLFFYLDGIIPDVVGFIPVENVDDLLKTTSLGPFRINRLDENRFEFKGERNTLHIRMQSKYAFVGSSKEAVDREFPDPIKMTSRLSNQYDIAASLNLRAIPQATRELLMTFLKTTTAVADQRRDNEPEAAWRFRTAGSASNMAALHQMVTQGDELTLGWKVDQATRQAFIEMVVVAVPGSDYALIMNQIKGIRSQFTALAATPAPMTISIASRIDKHGKRFFNEILRVAESELVGADKRLQPDGSFAPATPETSAAPGTDSSNSETAKSTGTANRSSSRKQSTLARAPEGPIRDLFDSMAAIVEGEILDACVQFVGEKQGGPYSLVGAMKIVNGEKAGRAIGDLMERFKKVDGIAHVELNATSYRGVKFHRMEPKAVSSNEEKLYGGKPSIYIGASDNTLWFAAGGADVKTSLEKSMDIVAKPGTESLVAKPMWFSMDLAQVVGLFGPSVNPDDKSAFDIAAPTINETDAQKRREAWQKWSREEEQRRGRRFAHAFSQGNGNLTLEMLPIDDGFRLRIQFDQAFIRFVGGEFVRGFDFGRAMREQGPAPGGNAPAGGSTPTAPARQSGGGR
jgi:hypothetical protein